MSRREQLAAVQSAEALLEARRRLVSESVRSRREALRRIHPALLLGGGVLSGIIAARVGAILFPSGLSLSSGVRIGARLLRLLPGGVFAPALRPDASQ